VLSETRNPELLPVGVSKVFECNDCKSLWIKASAKCNVVVGALSAVSSEAPAQSSPC